MAFIKILILLINLIYVMKVYLHIKLIKLMNQIENEHNLRSVYNIGCYMFQCMLPLFIMLDEEERNLRKWNKMTIISLSRKIKVLVYAFWILFSFVIFFAVYYQR